MNREFTFEAIEAEDVDSGRPAAQSPWEFSGYSAAVKDEHSNRRTTSLDHKISQLLSRKERKAEELRKQEENKESSKGLQKLRKPVAVIEGEEDDGEEDDEDEDIVEERLNEKAAVSRKRKPAADEGQAEDDEDDDGDEEGYVEGREGIFEGEEYDAGEVEDPQPAGRKGKKARKQVVEVEDESDDEAQEARQAVVVEEARQQGADGTTRPGEFFASSEGASFNATSFVELNISRPLVRACGALGYKQPTPIQAACIPLGLTGRDICGSAVTGSGKTAAFGLPLLERLLYRPRRIPAIRVLILTPTRELAVQVHSMLEKLAQFTDIRSCLVVGGLSSKVQETALRSRPDIVVATPGRMIDHLHNSQSVGLEELSILVLDEADRLLELGFTKEVHELVRLCPKRRQTMLFSATMTDEVDKLVKLSLNRPIRLSADKKAQRPSTLTEEIVKIRPSMEGDMEAVLLALCTRTFRSKVIVFSGTKAEAHRLKIMFELLGLKAAELHGNLTQAMRLDALEIFRKQEADFLLATDVAARGLDILGVETIINYECPSNITTYVHRVGRTARAGQQGCAVTFVKEADRALLKAVDKRGGQKLKSRMVPQGAIATFRQKIEDMEGDIKFLMQEERDERLIRKAEMEASKAQNMMEFEDEIFARPKRIWFQTEKEKKVDTRAAKDAKFGRKDKVESKKFLSPEEAEELKKKEKRQREREKNLPRKKRRQLEAKREEANDADDSDSEEENTKSKKGGKAGRSVVDVAYQRAKAVKGEVRAQKAGKLPVQRQDSQKKKKAPNKRKKEEMEELFEGDMSAGKKKKPGFGGGKNQRKPGVSKHSFKSKARYKRRK